MVCHMSWHGEHHCYGGHKCIGNRSEWDRGGALLCRRSSDNQCASSSCNCVLLGGNLIHAVLTPSLQAVQLMEIVSVVCATPDRQAFLDTSSATASKASVSRSFCQISDRSQQACQKPVVLGLPHRAPLHASPKM
jgi:hypothetical protein